MAVPEQGQLLAERVRVVEDAVEPAGLEPFAVARVEDAFPEATEDHRFLSGRAPAARAAAPR